MRNLNILKVTHQKNWVDTHIRVLRGAVHRCWLKTRPI